MWCQTSTAPFPERIQSVQSMISMPETLRWEHFTYMLLHSELVCWLDSRYHPSNVMLGGMSRFLSFWQWNLSEIWLFLSWLEFHRGYAGTPVTRYKNIPRVWGFNYWSLVLVSFSNSVDQSTGLAKLRTLFESIYDVWRSKWTIIISHVLCTSAWFVRRRRSKLLYCHLIVSGKGG